MHLREREGEGRRRRERLMSHMRRKNNDINASSKKKKLVYLYSNLVIILQMDPFLYFPCYTCPIQTSVCVDDASRNPSFDLYAHVY